MKYARAILPLLLLSCAAANVTRPSTYSSRLTPEQASRAIVRSLVGLGFEILREGETVQARRADGPRVRMILVDVATTPEGATVATVTAWYAGVATGTRHDVDLRDMPAETSRWVSPVLDGIARAIGDSL